LLFTSQTGWTKFLPLPEPDLWQESAGDYAAGGASDRGRIYVAPNEVNPEDSIPIMRAVTSGVYVSVGAERGFINFSLAHNATHLLLIDLVPQVVLFNRVNVALLKASDSLEDFLRLRTTPNRADFLARVNHSALSRDDKELLGNAEVFKTFSSIQNAATERLLDPRYFKGVSYLRDPVLFERLRQAAREGRIQVLKGNFGDTKFLADVAAEMRRLGLKIAALDISNAWERRYTTREGVKRIVSAFSPAMKADSFLVVSKMREQIGENKYIWDFMAYKFKTLMRVVNELKTTTSLTSLVYHQQYFPGSKVVEPSDVSEGLMSYVRDEESRFPSCHDLFN
jgi:hypothetical protein